MRKEVVFPRRIRSDEDGYNKLVKIVCEIFDGWSGIEFIFDFSKVEWIDANLLAVIGAAIEERKSECTFRASMEIQERQRNLWKRNGFGMYFEMISNRNRKNDTAIEYSVFQPSDVFGFGEYIDEKLLSKRGFPKLSTKLKRRISNNIQEIFGNALLHGRCKRVTSCGQYFYRKKKLVFSIVDCGTTICENVADYFTFRNQPMPDHAVLWAMGENNSTKEMLNGRPGGMGLYELREFIALNNGGLQICSGNEFYEWGMEENTVYMETSFPGTIVTMIFNMDDSNSYCLSSEKSSKEDLF